MKLKAYQVDSGNEDGNCVIAFASNNATARRAGANELGYTFEEVESCRRAPEFDSFASLGKVPPLVLIEHQWRFECGHCGVWVGEETYTYDEDGAGGERYHEPVVDSLDRVYCCASHMAEDFADSNARRAEEVAAIEAAFWTFPGITQVTGGMRSRAYPAKGEELRATFRFPGGQHAVSWRVGEAHVSISCVDVAAWEAYRGCTEPAL